MNGMDLAKAVAEQGTSLIVAVVALMTFTHFRGAHLSDRVRENVEEWLGGSNTQFRDASINDEHNESLKSQTEIFLKRHRWMSGVFISLTATLTLTMTAILFCNIDGEQAKTVGLVFATLGLISWLIALVFLSKEFVDGRKTLEMHASIMRRNRAQSGKGRHHSDPPHTT